MRAIASGSIMHRKPLSVVLSYLAGIVFGTALAAATNRFGVRNDVYVMFAVLLIVGVALAGGIGPALVAAITAVAGDDLILAGRLPPVEHWAHLVAFGGVAASVGWLVASERRQQIETEQSLIREQELRNERSSILAAVSHDVRSPLSVILGTVRQARLRPLGADSGRLLGRIESAALQAQHLVDVLTDLRAFDGQDVQLTLVSRDLRTVLASAVDQLQALSTAHHISLTLTKDPVVAELDEARLRRVLGNLIGNAIKYSPDGGEIEVRLDAAADQAQITVRDYGVGIPPEARTRVFDRGYRASTGAHIPGSGLGLFITAEIVKRHGGRIDCRAAPEKGTIFTITLPRTPQAESSTLRRAPVAT